MLAVDFYPGDSKRLVTCGKSHIAFWKVNGEKKLERKMGVFEVTLCSSCTCDALFVSQLS